MRKQVFALGLCLLLTAAGGSLVAQSAEELYSPYFFGLGPITTNLDSPIGTIFNPAAAALDQRIRLEANYIGLPRFTAVPDWAHAANLGLSLPTNFGVFSFNGHFLSSPYTDTNLGTFGGLNIAFSKDLYENFLIGIGVSSFVSSRSGVTDWSLGGDIGVRHTLGDVAFFKDVTWAFVFRNLGKGIAPSGTGPQYLPSPFTAALGLSFKPVKTDTFAWTVYSDFSFPSFSNFKLSAGTEIAFFNTVYARASYHLDAAEAAAGLARFPFSFGLSAVFRFDLKGQESGLGKTLSGSDLRLDACYAPLQNDVHAMGLGVNLALGSIDRTPPAVNITPVRPADGAAAKPDDPVYVSPNLDGVQDALELETSIKDERFVKGYKLVITDKAGAVVRVIGNKEERPENVDAQNLLNRLVYVKSGIKIPERLTWDGASEMGGLVEDGEYSYRVEAWDDNGNTIATPPRLVVVDKTPPAAAARADFLVFSPNGDGNKDTLPLALSGSPEDVWQAVITDAAGKPVRRFEWKGKSPESLAWDGKDDAGALVPDGVYAFSLASKDRAGNLASRKVENIIINTVATPITMTNSTGFFSPNGDGVKDAVQITLTVPVAKGIESWTLTIFNAKKEAVRSFSGKDVIQLSFTFDGKSDSGAALAEGMYKAALDVRYQNGNNPKAETGEIVLDLTPPALKLSLDNPVFSPNNDGNKDFVTVSLDTSEEEEWSAAIHDARTKKVVRAWRWKGKPEARLGWGGQADDGTLLSDGVYNFLITSTDRAGNTTASPVQALTINTEETPVLFTAAGTHFSPNNDKVNDALGLLPQLKITAGIDAWTVLIKDKAGKTVKALAGKKQAPLSLQWDGTADSGSRASDGEYTALLQVLYANGNNPQAKTAPFFVDTTAPAITLSSDYTLFSPDNDGLKDALAVTQKSSEEDLWEAKVTDKNGKTVRSFFWKGKAENLRWDGKDDNGNRLPNGLYAYTVGAVDKAGNKAQAALSGIEIDATPTPVFITVDGRAFSPNGDKAFDTIDLNIYAENQKGIKAWSLELVHEKQGAQRIYKGISDLPARITWDGLRDNKQPAPEGAYTGVLTVEYAKGNKPVEKSTVLMLDVTAPEVEFRMSPLPFSPDNDGVEDELEITQKVTEATGVSQWKIEITDPEKNHFIGFLGKGLPAQRIVWNGLSDKGELVQAATDYKLEFSIADEVGNRRSFEKFIPVDVLVIRDGDKLYVRVPSITFKPDTADYKTVAKEALEKNLWTLQRLAQIFTKYRTYNILIEGHAVSVFWRDPVRSQREQTEELIPLSKKRAEAVRQALIDQGIEASRISTEGVGAKRPLFPFSDEVNLWKNRRVEFILLKK